MSSKFSLSKEQILKGVVQPFYIILAFVLSFLPEEDKAQAQEILDEAAAGLHQVTEKLEAGVTIDEAVQAGFEIADTITDGTPNTTDDAVVESAKAMYNVATGSGGGLIAAIKGFIGIHKAKKADKAAESSTDVG